MKRFVTLLFFIGLSVLGKIYAQVSVTATGGTLGPTAYTDLITAFTAINNGTHTGSITVSITASFSQGTTAILNASGSGSASYTAITIKPAASANPVITNTTDNTASIKLDGADNVTIDGSNNGTTTQNLTFQNSNSSGSGQGSNIWLASNGTNGATNNVIKNCKILGSSYTLGAAYMGVCIYSSTTTLTGYWIATSATTGANNNNLIQNNLFNSANAAVVFNGGAGIGETGNQIIGNVIGDPTANVNTKFTNACIFMLNQANFTISQNTIRWQNAINTNVAPASVSIGAGCTNGNITRNAITGARFTTAVLEGGILLNAGASSNINVYNNFISDVASSGSATIASNAYGIAIGAGSGYNIGYNSVNMNTDPTTTATGYQAALYIASGITGLNIRNNIFAHTAANTTNKFSVYSVSANPGTSVINYNDYYTTAANLAYAGSNQTTLANVQTNLQNALNNSKNVAPVFVAATDLHLVAANASNIANLAGAATPIAGVTVDYDNNARGTLPTIGAHELSVASCPAPTSPTATSITTTTASLNWTQLGTPSQWQIKYGAPGFNVNTAGTSIFTPTKPYTLNPPLTAFTSYDYYVRAICSVGDTSAWSPVTNFTTLCNAPSVVSKKDSFNCGTGPVILEATTTSGASIKWYPAATGGTALATGNSYTTPSISVTTTYYISAISGTCESTPRQAVVATIRPIPTVNLGPDTTLCPGVSLTLNAGNAGGSYLWSPGGQTTQTISTNAVGQYIVNVTVNGCSKRDTILIIPGIAPVNNLPDTTNLCAGDETTLNAANTGSTFVWTPGGATTQTLNVDTGGTRSVVITSTNHCKLTSSTYVKMRPLPVDNLGNDTTICESVVLVLDAGNPGYSYLWNTGATTQAISTADSGSYVVVVTTPYACKHTDSTHIAFLPSPRTEGFSFIPRFYDEMGKVEFYPLNPTNVNSFEWDFGDGSPLVTAMNPVHVFAASGHYNVTLKVYNDCTDFSLSQVINVDLPTGTATINKNNFNLNIYPNPAKSVLNISNKDADYEMQDVMLFNAVGAMVYHQKADSKAMHQLSVESLSSGVYFVRVLTNKGFVNQQVQVVK
ncbi:T9SS type A sorting domain-containing protein [Taibaiella lutea]|uniref:T9SS type A sorting domain-containing protein n=1 Tax=Taibaiella lutea TaxID=2608001 RepID=A0A5M6CDH8_9BACT|nr:T9SS type A sorting domain-containing protein [Taibaiella lutea]KAA5533176.1 T9SS type A sorting domain-containing protein [Taibaiella lutea]